jgi:hypothetical protein
MIKIIVKKLKKASLCGDYDNEEITLLLSDKARRRRVLYWQINMNFVIRHKMLIFIA